MPSRTARGERLLRARPVRRKGEHGPAEEGEPQCHDDADETDVFGLALVQSERRGIGQHEKPEHQEEAADAASVAQSPGPARKAAETGPVDEVRQHRVVEHGGRFEADVDEGDQDEGGHDPACVRSAEPECCGCGDRDQAEASYPGLASASRIGDRSRHGREKCDDQCRDRDAPAPQRQALGFALCDGPRKIGCEDEGDDDRGRGRIRPVEKAPRDEAPAPHGLVRSGLQHVISRLPPLAGEAACLRLRPDQPVLPGDRVEYLRSLIGDNVLLADKAEP